MIPDPDYHEADEFQPTMLALAHFIIQWNYAERSFSTLIWHYTGGIETGAVVSASLGNKTRAQALLSIVRKQEKNPKILDLIEFCALAFSRVKENRNSLAHAHTIFNGDDENPKPRWVRTSTNPNNANVYCYADLDDVAENINAANLLTTLAIEIAAYHFAPTKPEPLTERFELPKTLVSIPELHETHEDPPQPSQE